MASVTQQDLDQARRELAGGREGSAEDCFPVVYLERAFGLPREQAALQAGAGAGELGVNAFHADRELKNFYLLRCEWSSKPGCFEVPLLDLAESGLERIFGEGPPGIVPDQFLVRLKTALLEAHGVVERIFVVCAFRGDPVEAERGAVYDLLREEIENKKHVLDRFFGRPVTLAFQFRSVAGEVLGAPVHQRVTHAYPLRLEGVVQRTGPGGEAMRLGFAKLTDLHAMFKGMGSRFLERNIRSLLSGDTPTNRSLARAFEAVVVDQSRDPLAFAFDHNGVTLFAEKAEGNGDVLTLTEPRLLNGAQTLAALDRFLEARKDSPALAAGRGALEELAVQCKVITDARREFMLSVTLNNNRQNPVRPWNLHANDLVQLQLQDKFREALGLYYERQERAFEFLAEEDREELEAGEGKAIQLLKLAQTFLAADGDVEQMGKLSPVFEDEQLYREVFHPKRLKADARAMLLVYKIQLRLPRIVREVVLRGERKYGWLKRSRHLLWALLAQGVLNEDEGGVLRGKFGRRLGMEAEYVELLLKLAAGPIRLAIGGAAETEPFSGQLAAERFGVLKSNAFHDACLKRVQERAGWSKRGLP